MRLTSIGPECMIQKAAKGLYLRRSKLLSCRRLCMRYNQKRIAIAKFGSGLRTMWGEHCLPGYTSCTSGYGRAGNRLAQQAVAEGANDTVATREAPKDDGEKSSTYPSRMHNLLNLLQAGRMLEARRLRSSRALLHIRT